MVAAAGIEPASHAYEKRDGARLPLPALDSPPPWTGSGGIGAQLLPESKPHQELLHDLLAGR